MVVVRLDTPYTPVMIGVIALIPTIANPLAAIEVVKNTQITQRMKYNLYLVGTLDAFRFLFLGKEVEDFW